MLACPPKNGVERSHYYFVPVPTPPAPAPFSFSYFWKTIMNGTESTDMHSIPHRILHDMPDEASRRLHHTPQAPTASTTPSYQGTQTERKGSAEGGSKIFGADSGTRVLLEGEKISCSVRQGQVKRVVPTFCGMVVLVGAKRILGLVLGR